jgi:hypothetical protein
MTPTSTASSPLTLGHRDMLIESQRRLQNVLPEIDKAESCGIDCSEFRQGHAYLSETVGRYLDTYFPHAAASGLGGGPPTAAQ